MRVFLVILALLLPGGAKAAAASPRDSSPVKRILVFGDSLSDGIRLKRSEAYPALLAQKLRDAGLTRFEVTNASVNGGTARGGLERIDAQLKRPVDIFVLELGINDAFRGATVDKIRSNLQAIIDRVKARNSNTRIVIVGMQLPNYSADDYVSQFGSMYAQLAAANNAAYVPYLLLHVAGDPRLNLPDRIHPNAAGHKVMANTVWQALEPVAREVAAREPADKESSAVTTR